MPLEPETTPPDIERFVATLNEHGVEYVMIGGVAALFHGSSRATFDLDVLARGSLENLNKLANALSAMGAGQGLDSADLRGMTTRWNTTTGRVDVLLAARGPDGRRSIRYTDIIDGRVDMIYNDTTIPVVGLDDLIEMKTAVGRPHDLDTVTELLGLHGRIPPSITNILKSWEADGPDSQINVEGPELDL